IERRETMAWASVQGGARHGDLGARGSLRGPKKKGSGTVVRSTRRAVPAMVPDPFFLGPLKRPCHHAPRVSTRSSSIAVRAFSRIALEYHWHRITVPRHPAPSRHGCRCPPSRIVDRDALS